MMKSTLISDNTEDIKRDKAGLFNDCEVAGVYYNPSAEAKRARLQREEKKKLREFYKDRLKEFQNARHWKKEEQYFKHLNHATSKLEKQTKLNKMDSDLHDMAEMQWIQDEEGYIDPDEVHYAKAEAFYTDEFLEDEGYSLRFIQNLDILATEFLEEIDDNDDDDSTATPIISNCPSVSSASVTSGETNSIINPSDLDNIDVLPNDFSDHNDFEGYDMETLLCQACTRNSNIEMDTEHKLHSGNQVDPGTYGNLVAIAQCDRASNFRKIKQVKVKGIQDAKDQLFVDHVTQLHLPHPSSNVTATSFASDKVTRTVLSPQALCREYGWNLYILITNMKDGTARLIFNTGSDPLVYECIKDNAVVFQEFRELW